MMRTLSLMLLSVIVAACAGDAGAPDDDASTPPVAVVDSIHPMPVMIERFQQKVGRPVTALPERAALSRDSLVARLVRAVEDSSAAALHGLRVDAATYAYLVVPTSPMSAEPYRQPPELGWMLIDENSAKGEFRLIRTFGGRPLGFRGYSCADSTTEGENRLWTGCTVELEGRELPLRLFGTIIERDGRFMFLSMGNDL